MDWNIGRIAFDCLSQATQYENRIGESEVLHVLQIRNTEQQQQPVAAAAETPMRSSALLHTNGDCDTS